MKKPNMETVRQIEAYEPADYLSSENAQRLITLCNAGPHWEVQLGLSETTAVSYSQAIEGALALSDNERIQVPYAYYSSLLGEIQELMTKANEAFAEALKKSPNEVLKALQREVSRIVRERRVPVENQAKVLGLSREKVKDLTECPPSPPEAGKDAPEYGEYLDKRFFNDFFSDDVLRQTHIKPYIEHLTVALEAAGEAWPERGRVVIDRIIARKWAVGMPQVIRKQPHYPVPDRSSDIVRSNHPAVNNLMYGSQAHDVLMEQGRLSFTASFLKGKEKFEIQNTVEIFETAPDVLPIGLEDAAFYIALETVVGQYITQHRIPQEEWEHTRHVIRIPAGTIARDMSRSDRSIDRETCDYIRRMVERLRKIDVRIYCEREAEAHDFFFTKESEPLLDAKTREWGNGSGSDMEIWLHTVPILLRYALLSKKYITLDPRFTSRGPLAKTPQMQVLRNYLERRIMTGYRRGDNAITISLQTLYKALFKEDATKSAKRVIRDTARNFLREWERPDDNAGLQFIADVDPIMAGRSITGFRVTLLNRKPEAFKNAAVNNPETTKNMASKKCCQEGN